ncbi:MAG: N-acetylmuramoyl-L-alanine amidase [Candidatus Omnitrophica bacterium]|nr:N-acetylmuramoyl-L-alanine amidase [Candidatus Omnitrophota bacterium]
MKKNKLIFSQAMVMVSWLFLLFGCATVPPPLPTAPMRTDGVLHVVGSGQTLWRIAKVYNIDMQEIMRANNISDANQIGVGEQLFIPRATRLLFVEPYRPEPLQNIELLVSVPKKNVLWRTITLHHSGTLKGNAESFDRNHRSRNMGGLFYHFVIGNGTDSGNGEIEVGWRWRKQAYVERKADIQICLVGDYNRQPVSDAQYASVVKLIRVLMKRHRIPLASIRTHQKIKGKITDCPGEQFPFARILSELKK